MQITDTIADLLTRIRNANSAKHDTVDIPASNMKKAIVQILVDEGYVKSFTVIEDGKQGIIRVTLKYGEGKTPVINGPAQGFQARPAHLHQRRGYAQGHEGPGHRDRFHFQGRYDRPSGPQGECRRRSPRIYLVRRGCRYVSNWKKTHKYSRWR